MVSMPNIKVEKPKRMVPVSFFLLVFPNMKRTVPTVARMGVKDVGFNMRIKKLSLEMPLRLKSHAVTVVPTFAPIITFIACFKVITPELTKPTTITVAAEELCITAVTIRPVRKPAVLLWVSLARSSFKLPSARRSSASLITLIPNRNRLKPPASVKASKIPITDECLLFIKDQG